MQQTKVDSFFLSSGTVGEFYSTSPQRTRSAILKSTDQANNVVGRVVKHQKDSKNVGVAQSGAVAGILGFPKQYVRPTLANVKAIPNGQPVEVVEQGYIYVEFMHETNSTCNIGDWVYYNPTDGMMTPFAPTQSCKTNYKRLQGATVAIENVSVTGKTASSTKYMAIIYLDLAGDASEKTA